MEHLEFDRIKIEDRDRRKKPGFGLPIPQKKFKEQGHFIEQTVNNSVSNIRSKSREFNFNPYLVLKVELEDNVQFTEEEENKLELFGLKIIDKESNRLQVVFSQDLQLAIFKEELQSYKNGKIAQKKVKNEDLFSKIKEISEWGRNDRLQFDLRDINENDYVDVYLWVFDSKDISGQKMKEFKEYILTNDCRVCDDYVGESVVVARVRVKGNILDKILEHPLVYKVETISKIKIVLNEISNIKQTSIDDLEFDNTLLDPDNSSAICVIDSGIYAQHPLFKGVIGDAKTFYINDTDGTIDNSDDLSGHGTEVASICEYGDFEHNQKFQPEIYLHNAKIHNGQYDNIITLWENEVKAQIGEFTEDVEIMLSKYEEGKAEFEQVIDSFEKKQQPYVRMVYSKYSNMYEKLIPTQMREIVEYFYNNYGCRIYNLSQGDSTSLFNGNKPKAWACVLDELQNEYDILFVVSSGNYEYKNSNYENILNDYPKYFYNSDECKIIEPANSALSVSVGSMAISDNIYNALDRVNKIPITKREQLSTITRVGPGVQNSIKPEFIAYGGDFGIENDFLGRKKLTKNIGLSKLVFNNDMNGIFKWDIGTSFSAPYISHLAASILNKYQNVSNNLIRAIISNSAEISSTLIDINKNMSLSVNDALDEFKYKGKNNLSKMICYTSGYGFPNKQKCLNSFDNRVVLMADIKEQDALEIDKMHIFEIPLPDEFRTVKGKKRVIISLAYTPRVRNTRVDYIGISMDFKLIKGKSISDVIKIYESQKGKKEPIAKEKKYECNLEPGSTLRNKGTLQKGIFEFTKDKSFNNNNLYLVVNCIKGWDDVPQKYAVAITLESDNEAKFYNVIKNKIQERVQTKIKI